MRGVRGVRGSGGTSRAQGGPACSDARRANSGEDINRGDGVAKSSVKDSRSDACIKAWKKRERLGEGARESKKYGEDGGGAKKQGLG